MLNTNQADQPVQKKEEDAALLQKYMQLKKRVREIEEDNDAIHLQLAKAKRQIKRLRVERIVLLEELDQSRRNHRREAGGDKKALASGIISDSDISGSESSPSEFLTATTTTTTTTTKKAKAHNGSKATPKQHHETTAGTSAAPRKKRDPNAPKGPGNVFFLYCRLERDKIKDQVPSESLGEVTRLLGQKWKALSKEEKQKYYDMYNKELKEYEVAMKSYNAAGGGAEGSSAAAASSSNAEVQEEVRKPALDVSQEDEDIDMLPDEDDDYEQQQNGNGETNSIEQTRILSNNNIIPQPNVTVETTPRQITHANEAQQMNAPAASTAPIPEPASSTAPIDQMAGYPQQPKVSSIPSPEMHMAEPSADRPQ